MCRRMLFCAGLLAVVLWVPLWGQGRAAPRGGEVPPAQKEASPVLTVAVLDFEAKEAGGAEMGSKIGDLLTIFLSQMGNFEMVDRSKLEEVLKEQALSLTGAVDPEQAVQVGRLVGATCTSRPRW